MIETLLKNTDQYYFLVSVFYLMINDF